MNFFQTRNGVVIALIAIVVFLTVALIRRSRNADSNLNLDDLLLDETTGKISIQKFIVLVALGVTSLLIVGLWYQGKITEGYMGLYLTAWVAPLITWLVTNRPPQPQPNVANANVAGAVAVAQDGHNKV